MAQNVVRLETPHRPEAQQWELEQPQQRQQEQDLQLQLQLQRQRQEQQLQVDLKLKQISQQLLYNERMGCRNLYIWIHNLAREINISPSSLSQFIHEHTGSQSRWIFKKFGIERALHYFHLTHPSRFENLENPFYANPELTKAFYTSLLVAYVDLRSRIEKRQEYLHWYGHLFGSPKDVKIKAANALKNHIENGALIPNHLLSALSRGRLGKIFEGYLWVQSEIAKRRVLGRSQS